MRIYRNKSQILESVKKICIFDPYCLDSMASTMWKKIPVIYSSTKKECKNLWLPNFVSWQMNFSMSLRLIVHLVLSICFINATKLFIPSIGIWFRSKLQREELLAVIVVPNSFKTLNWQFWGKMRDWTVWMIFSRICFEISSIVISSSESSKFDSKWLPWCEEI